MWYENNKKEKPFQGLIGAGGGASGYLVGGSGGPPLLTEPLIFVPTKDSSGTHYIHGVKTDGTVVGRCALNGITALLHGFFYNPFLVLMSYYGNKINVIDCNTMSLYRTINSTSIATSRGFAPWSDGVYIAVSNANDSIYFLDLNTFSTSYVSYTADDGYNAQAGTHSTVGFADMGSNLFSTLGDRYWWQAGQSGSPYNGWYYYADRSGNTLGTKSSGYNTNVNYSRGWGVTMSSTKAYMSHFSSVRYPLTNTTTTPSSTPLPTSYTYGGNTYYTNPDGTDYVTRCANSSNIWVAARYSGGGANVPYTYRIAFGDPFSGSSWSDVNLELKGESTTLYYHMQSGTSMATINTAGYVAVAYLDRATYGDQTDRLNIKIYNGTTNVQSVSGIQLGTSYTSGHGGTSTSPTILSGNQWTTNLLYSGTTY